MLQNLPKNQTPKNTTKQLNLWGVGLKTENNICSRVWKKPSSNLSEDKIEIHAIISIIFESNSMKKNPASKVDF